MKPVPFSCGWNYSQYPWKKKLAASITITYEILKDVDILTYSYRISIIMLSVDMARPAHDLSPE